MNAPRRRRKGRSDAAIGYIRVSTEEQGLSGLGMEAQRQAIEAEAARRGLGSIRIFEDAAASGKNLDRPGLTEGLALLASGEANLLIVSRLDRLTRSVHDATGLMLQAERERWGLVALDVSVDTTTAQGAAMVQMLAVFAELERRMIGERTRAALRAKRRQGVKLGRPRTLAPEVADDIVTWRRSGEGWSAIARRLNEAGVPTARGGAAGWYPATVRAVYMSRASDQVAS